MTTNAGMLLEPGCCNPCDDGCGGCKDNCKCNIKSANPECLRVEVGECGEIILDPVCPPVVEGRDGIIVDEEPCEEGENCSKRYIVRGGPADDRKVAVCTQDTPGYLKDKLVAGEGITLDVNCSNSGKIVINAKDSGGECEHPEIRIQNASQLIQATAGGPDKHTIYISDREKEYYNNNVCIGFEKTQEFSDVINNVGNTSAPSFVKKWDICTGNKDMATPSGIKILESGYYRLFGQLTVHCNISELGGQNWYLNLGRGLLRIQGSRWSGGNNSGWFLSTAKHGAYTKQVLLQGGQGINVNADGVISVSGARAPEGGGTVSFNPGSGYQSQEGNAFTGPWMTFNMDTYVDLYKDEIITLGFRGQSDQPEATGQVVHFSFVGQDDSSTEYNALFGGTVLGVQMITPKLFQKDDSYQNNRVYQKY